ncbi:Hydrophobic protein OSR8 [Camellia lanceoleosa]|uniref:Hydrophobic protein OSR8 n=1 Tax=Camellia lanceoleosa TaxID=1840588 RepID=A0ACC0F4B3_9ERIC|nr:Hydrophobic protein OSR8 [Camellia lanceoleosa]
MVVTLVVEFFICLVLTILGYIPGIVYALYAMLCVDRDMTRADYRPLA